jgi:purine catabolism regulator
MKIHDILLFDALEGTRVVAAADHLDRDVHWVHIVDLPPVHLLDWVQAGQFLLTTGITWPREESQLRALIRALAERKLACVGMAVPQFFEHFPEAACDEASRQGLPLLELPWDIPYSYVTETVHSAILKEQYQVIEQSAAIHSALTRAAVVAKSLQELAEILGGLIGRAITFEDTAGHVLAACGCEQEEDTLRRTSRETGQTPADFLAHLASQGYWGKLQTASSPLNIPASPQFDFAARVVCPIRLQDELIGFVWIIEGERALSELDLRAAEHASIVAALHIARQREQASFEAKLGNDLLSTLFEGKLEITPEGLERAQLLGFNPRESYRVGLVVLDEAVPLSSQGLRRRELLAERLRQRMHFLSLAPLLSVSLNHVYFLLSETCPVERIWSALKGEENYALALGQAYAGVEGIKRSYHEARSLLAYLSPGTCQSYEDLLLPRVLMGDGEARVAFLDRLLGKLQKERNGDILCETLLAWARSGFHLAQGAASLNVHPKTLKYRLVRAGELGELDLAHPETRFHLQLASHLLSFQDKKFLKYGF